MWKKICEKNNTGYSSTKGVFCCWSALLTVKSVAIMQSSKTHIAWNDNFFSCYHINLVSRSWLMNKFTYKKNKTFWAAKHYSHSWYIPEGAITVISEILENLVVS